MRVHIKLYIQVVIITFNVVVSSCFFLVAVVCIVLFFFCLQRTCSKSAPPRAAQFSVLVRPIKFLFNIGVVIADPAVDVNTHLSYLLHQSVCVLTTDIRFVTL